jgi:hypothetical protein
MSSLRVAFCSSNSLDLGGRGPEARRARVNVRGTLRSWFAVPALSGVALLQVACAAEQSTPASAADCARADATPGLEPPGQKKALPRYFTLELVGTETRVDGRPLRGHDLSVRIDTEAKDEGNGGVLIRLDDEFSGEVLGAIVWELSTAGFSHIIVWRRASGESEAEALAPPAPEPAPVTSVEPAPAPTPQVSESAPPDAPADASVRTIGLHVGGGPNDDATRGKFIAPIEKEFDALLRCHALAEKRDRNASVGVDLLIPAGGGRAKVQDLRTALRGDEFKGCAQTVFERVEFPSVARATVVSYSMLFEPVPGR